MNYFMSTPEYAYITHKQEAFSEAHLRAICAAAGCSFTRMEMDNDKVDYIVKSRVQGTVRTKPQIDMQSKCMMTTPATGVAISYSIDSETYNNLRDPLVSSPRILVLVLIPPGNTDDDTSNWIDQTHKQSIINYCAYWVSLKNEVPITTASKTISIPISNVLTPAALRTMMVNASNGVDL